MARTRFVALLVVLLAVTASAGWACACSAPDGSCSTTTSCPGGCYAVCGAGGCSSGCSGGRDPLPVAGTKARTLTYAGEGVTASSLQDLVRDELGATLLFVPKKAGDQFNVDLHGVSAGDLLHALSKIGAAALLDRPVNGEQKAGHVHFSLKAENVAAGTVAALLREVFGDAVSIELADPASAVSLDLENVTLRDLREALPKAAGLKVREERAN